MIAAHLIALGYNKKLPKATPMLTEVHKQRRVEWAKRHLHDNWNKTVFTDETAFQLFRNTVERWYKGERQFQKIVLKFCMNAELCIGILKRHISEIRN